MTLSEPSERSKKQERAPDGYNVQDADKYGTADLTEINDAGVCKKMLSVRGRLLEQKGFRV